VKISLSWLREFVDITESTEELRVILDDLGLVVEGVERVGEGLKTWSSLGSTRFAPLRALTECDSSSWTPVTVPSRSSVAP